MLILIEGIVICFFLLVVCAGGISNGAVALVNLYEPEVQERVVELGLITKERIKRNNLISGLAIFIPTLVFPPLMVYFINGGRNFLEIYIQVTAIVLIGSIFDRIFIDWYWVGHTKAWIIPGTEDLMPYIPKRTVIKKWIGTLVAFPIMTAAVSAVTVLLTGGSFC